MHIVFIDSISGAVLQCSRTTSVPTGEEYWFVTPEEKEFMDANREHRDAWEFTPSRPADGIGE